MDTRLEEQLRKALQPVDPGEGFAERVMRRIEHPEAHSRHGLPLWFRVFPVALAASAVLGAILIHAWHAERERQGLEARRQLIQALHVTGEKLDLAYRGVNRQPPFDAPDDSGA